MKLNVSRTWKQVAILIKISIIVMLVVALYIFCRSLHIWYCFNGNTEYTFRESMYSTGVLVLAIIVSALLYFVFGLWLPRFMWSHAVISEKNIKSVILFRTKCVINRELPIYYAKSRYNVGRGTNENFVFISNEPFKLAKRKGLLTLLNIYDPAKQIALPDNNYTCDLLNNAIFIGRLDFPSNNIRGKGTDFSSPC